ncbi:uncharacterized protein LOC124787635 isoform X2 [Schistocerca piceifrons]|uniref:uncharacterized protein LOC124787635 isoform X2 n=1 Tax=Schistocerca piceifrons TaxID=274613 RepID=UPI001F5E7C14|nr:uncharacterized protein LOC124787635 isoform X2 [Schistocerca piceifrons]
MAAEQIKLKCAFRTGALLVVVLLQAVAYGTATGVFLSYIPDPATNVVPNVPPETYFHYVVDIDSVTQPTLIRIKQEPYVVVKVSNFEFCTVIWSNKHLLRRVPARRAIKDFCRSIRQSGKEMATATEVTSELDVTATGESGKALRAEARLAERQHPSAEALNLKKLTEWCKHRKHIDNKLVRVYLSDICSNLGKTAPTTLPAKSFGPLTAVPVTTDTTTDPTTEAETDVTSKGAYASQPAVSGVEPKMGGASNYSHIDLTIEICQNLHILDIPQPTRRVMGIFCRLQYRTENKAVMAMEGTSNTTQPSDLKAQHRRFFKLRVCPHLEQAKELKFLSSNLPSYCKDLANEGTDMSAESYGTVTFAQVAKDADPMTETVTLKTAYTYNAQSAVTSLKPEMGAAYNISDTELGLLLCENFHLVDNSVPFMARRALLLYCKIMNLTDTGTSTAAATEVMSAPKLTTTAAAGTSEGPFDTSRVPDTEQAATSVTQQEEASSHISSLTKLREVCRHLNQVKNKMFGPFIPGLCKHVDEPDVSAESNGTVTAAQVTRDADPMTDAVTLKTAYTYSAQSAVTSLKPETGATHNISDTELGLLVCQNLLLLDNSVSYIARRALAHYCKIINPTDTATSTAAATEVMSAPKLTTTAAAGTSEGPFDTSRVPDAEQAATSLTQQEEPSSHISSLTKLSQLCRHQSEVKNKMFGPFLPGLCKHVAEPDKDMSAESNGTVTTAQVTKDADPITEAVTLKTAYIHSAQSVVTSLKPEMGTAYNISNTELGVLVCENLHLIDNSVSFLARRTLGLYCKIMNLTGTGTSTAAATEVMSAPKLTTTAAAGTSEEPFDTSRVPDTEEAATSLTQQEEPSSHISSLTKLRQLCRHLNQVKNKMFGPFLPGLCKHVNETDMSAESNGTVTAGQVTRDADPMTEAVTLKTAYTYSAQSAVTSLKPETGATHNISDTELGLLVCQNLLLLDNSVSYIARRTLAHYCKIINPTGTGTSTAAATEVMSAPKLTTTAAAGTSEGPFDTSRVPDAELAATSVTQQEEPSSHISSLTKLRQLCRHQSEVKNKMFGPFLPGLCKHVAEPGSTSQPHKLMTSSSSGEPVKESNDESVDEAGDGSTDEAAQPTTLMTNTRRHESIDESINKSYEECGFELYDDIVIY